MGADERAERKKKKKTKNKNGCGVKRKVAAIIHVIKNNSAVTAP